MKGTRWTAVMLWDQEAEMRRMALLLRTTRPPESEPEALGWSAVRVACLCQPSPNSGYLGDLGGQVQRLAEAHS